MSKHQYVRLGHGKSMPAVTLCCIVMIFEFRTTVSVNHANCSYSNYRELNNMNSDIIKFLWTLLQIEATIKITSVWIGLESFKRIWLCTPLFSVLDFPGS